MGEENNTNYTDIHIFNSDGELIEVKEIPEITYSTEDKLETLAKFLCGEIKIAVPEEARDDLIGGLGIAKFHAEYEFIKSAFEKQIPKKLVDIFEINRCGDLVAYSGRCECGNLVSAYHHYCPWCGQALDWSKE